MVLVSFWKRARLKKSIALLYKKFTTKKQKPKPKPKPENPSLFLSLPDELILNCLAHISKSYYPQLSLVCKTFRTLILSIELGVARFHLKIKETFFNVCLQFPNNPRPSLFALWIKPGQILTNQLEKKTSTRNTRLVQVPSSYYSFVPRYNVTIGSEVYALNQYNDRSSMMWVRNKDSCVVRNAPNMTVARAKALAVKLNGKIYVMGGCVESANWAEVFDPKTQTWETLPDPGAELRFSSVRNILVSRGKLYVRSNENKDSVYDPKEGKWDVLRNALVVCEIDNISYCCQKLKCVWYDTNGQEWRAVRGLDMLNGNPCGFIEIANYCGKLLMLWDKFVDPAGSCEDKDIWCAMIAVERRDDTDEVWGNIEWANVVLTVPSSCVFLHSLINIH